MHHPEKDSLTYIQHCHSEGSLVATLKPEFAFTFSLYSSLSSFWFLSGPSPPLHFNSVCSAISISLLIYNLNKFNCLQYLQTCIPCLPLNRIYHLWKADVIVCTIISRDPVRLNLKESVQGYKWLNKRLTHFTAWIVQVRARQSINIKTCSKSNSLQEPHRLFCLSKANPSTGMLTLFKILFY